jgi:hypothetical protein
LTGTPFTVANPNLGPLQNNGGPTLTMAPQPGSPALDAGSNAVVTATNFGDPPFTDQRGPGFVRISNGTVDLGAIELQVSPPTVLPTVQSVVIHTGAAQRSRITHLTITFSEPVVLDAGAVELVTKGGGPAAFTLTVIPTSGGTVATLTFPGRGRSLPDGNFVLTIHGDRIRNAAGALLDGNGDGSPGGDRVDEFFRFYGDSNGDRRVNKADNKLFKKALGKKQGQKGFQEFFDFNGDGKINAKDAAKFKKRLGKGLAP